MLGTEWVKVDWEEATAQLECEPWEHDDDNPGRSFRGCVNAGYCWAEDRPSVQAEADSLGLVVDFLAPRVVTVGGDWRICCEVWVGEYRDKRGAGWEDTHCAACGRSFLDDSDPSAIPQGDGLCIPCFWDRPDALNRARRQD